MIARVISGILQHRLRTLVVVCIAIISLVVGCAASSQTTGSSASTSIATTYPSKYPTPTPTFPQAAGTPLPAFSDWRAAYMSQDGTIHVVTLDGKADISGPKIPFASPGQPIFYGSGIANAGFAPNGTALASASPSLNIIDAATGKQIDIPESPLSAPNSEAWSPDGHTLAMAGGNYDFDLTNASNGNISVIPHTPFPGNPPEANILDGWLDATHVAVDGFLPSVVGQATVTWAVYSLDVSTGEHKTIAQIQRPNYTEDDAFVLSPDRTKGLFYNVPYRDNPFTPYVVEIDMATGTITPLPAVARLFTYTDPITNVAWKPGTQTVAIAAGFSKNHDLKDWLVDLSQESSTPLPTIGYPIKWSPDGKTLIMSSAEQNASSVGAGPFTLTALTFGATGQATQTQMTTQAYNFNFIGFIRTANGS